MVLQRSGKDTTQIQCGSLMRSKKVTIFQYCNSQPNLYYIFKFYNKVQYF